MGSAESYSRRSWRPPLSALLILSMLMGCGEASPPDTRSPAMVLELTSSDFRAGGRIPQVCTGEGEDRSPQLSWGNAPDGTREFALICDDPDAPTRHPWVHWVIYGIDAKVATLPAGFPTDPTVEEPVGACQGKNSWPDGQTIGYRGPMPPPGHGQHHYHFKLYALDTRLHLPAKLTKDQLLAAMQGHILAEGELVGTYERK